MKSHEVNAYIVKRGNELVSIRTRWEVVRLELEKKGVTLSNDAVRKRFNNATKDQNLTEEPSLEKTIEASKVAKKTRDDRKVIKESVTEIERLTLERDAAIEMRKQTNSYVIKSKLRGKSESTALLIWSDWHVEENVDPDTVNDMNEFTLKIAKERIEKLVTKNVDMIKLFQLDTEINEVIIALLGDFISGDIHEELLETAEVPPMEALIWVQSMIISAIEYILENTEVKLTIPCHSGNHARTTAKSRNATEAGHSLEYMMYHNIARHFEDEPRITFLVTKSHWSFIELYGMVIRFHHGHKINYRGGVGKIFPSAFNAISKLDDTRKADLDIFGHFHVTYDGGTFICNGSLIGYTAYSARFGYEPPKQTFLLIHKNLGRTIMAPIYL